MKPAPIVVNQVPGKQSTSQLLADKMTCLLNNVRARAYEFFEQRGRCDGNDLDDWLRAESELGALPTSAIEQTGAELRVRIKHPELTVNELKVYAEPQAITVEWSAARKGGSEDSQNRSERMLYGRYELPVQINTGLVTAALKAGVLEIVARRTESPAEKPPKPSAHSAPLETQPQGKKSAACQTG